MSTAPGALRPPVLRTPQINQIQERPAPRGAFQRRGRTLGPIREGIGNDHRLLLELLRIAYFTSMLTFAAIAAETGMQQSHVSEFMRGHGPYPRWRQVQALAAVLRRWLPREVREEDFYQLWEDGAREKKKGKQWFGGCLAEKLITLSPQSMATVLFMVFGLFGLAWAGLNAGQSAGKPPSSTGTPEHVSAGLPRVETYQAPSPVRNAQPQFAVRVAGRMLVYRVPGSHFQQNKGVQIFELRRTQQLTFTCQSRDYAPVVYLKVSGSQEDYVSTRGLRNSAALKNLDLPDCPELISPSPDERR
ncbi:hypothetical protein [Streptomyces sp. NPDC002328]|uniref:hypothetical protein n=1 Tax=Streptomyces sp. NPDC002328 TaxID=3364642 RepID=UPI0036AA31F9